MTSRETLLSVTFGAGEISQVRHRVEAASRQCGLAGDQLVDWVTAINELTTNAVRHGSASAELTLWHNDELTCQVSDSGAGFDPSGFFGRTQRPQPSATGGLGLWLVERATRLVSVSSGADGTIVQVAALP